MAILSYPLINQYVVLLLREDNGTSTSTSDVSNSKISKNSSGSIVGYIVLTLVLLTLSALLSGLTLAVCSLDMAWLHVLSTTGCEKQRYRSLVVARIRRRTSWFLCSMIVCSVACTESIPIIIRDLVGSSWQPIIISTIAVAILAELLPQYFIPRQALFWGYYCWPIIWACMWITCAISWPISLLLDKCAGSLTDKGIFSSEQLSVLVKYHERSEKHGGLLGPDAGRISRSALILDGQTLRGQSKSGAEAVYGVDIERHATATSNVIVPWRRVRCVDINEEVTKEFIKQVREWAYSRIPVVGDGDVENCDSESSAQCWNGQKLYGFLHVKNLLGVAATDREHSSGKIFVKDLLLYPLPIVRDDLPVYDLLSLFQMGISRIAVIIRTPSKDRIVPLGVSEKNADTLPRHRVPLWSAAEGLNTRHIVEMCELDKHIDWTTDFLDAAQNNTVVPVHRKQTVIGIGCPEPLGIVTYEDILEALLQKTSYDEKDFFDRVEPTTKPVREGDASSVMSTKSVVRTRKGVPDHIQRSYAGFEHLGQGVSTLRKRNVSMPIGGYDGADDASDYEEDGAAECTIAIHRKGIDDASSSYTNSSRGGSHRNGSSTYSLHDTIPMAAAEPAFVKHGVPFSPFGFKAAVMRSASSPGKIMSRKPFSGNSEPTRRHKSDNMSLPRLRRVTPFSNLSFAIHEEPPSPTLSHRQIGMFPESAQRAPLHSLGAGNMMRLDNSSHTKQCRTQKSAPLWESGDFDANSPVTVGFQHIPEGQDSQSHISRYLVRESGTLGHVSTSLPRMNSKYFGTADNGVLPARDQSFHDDRALLPSQSRIRNVLREHESISEETCTFR